MKYNNIGLSNYIVEALNESSQRLRESKNRIAQVSFDVMYDPEDEEHTPEDVVYNVEWEFENTDTFGNCRLLGTGIEDLTDVYRSNYGNEFGELEESCNKPKKLNEANLQLADRFFNLTSDWDPIELIQDLVEFIPDRVLQNYIDLIEETE